MFYLEFLVSFFRITSKTQEFNWENNNKKQKRTIY